MPLGNLTSQFFANVYLNDLDYFIKHNLKCNYYIRYVDDFVILHKSQKQLENCLNEIKKFLGQELRLNLHPDKTKINELVRGLEFVGFRNFYHQRLLRKRNILYMKKRVSKFLIGNISKEKFDQIIQGWNTYAKWTRL